MKPRLLLLTPPLVQTNTPYPATMHLTGFLRGRGYAVEQRDLGIKVARDVLIEYGGDEAEQLLELLSGNLPPEEKLEASKLIDELALWIRDNVDSSFGFSRYAERISAQAADFGEIEKLIRKRGVIDKPLERRLEEAIAETRPTLIGVTCPFPGTLVPSFKIARYVRKHYPDVKLLLGGGFVSTELREMNDPRPRAYFDAFMFDEGYGPMLAVLAEQAHGPTVEQAHGLAVEQAHGPAVEQAHGLAVEQASSPAQSRSFKFHNRGGETPPLRENDTPPLRGSGSENSLTEAARRLFCEKDLSIPPFVTPSYDGIDWSEYFDVVETENPMHRLWSVGRWRKLQMARGCYWHRCAFCDVKLPYINCFEQPDPREIVDAMEALGGGRGVAALPSPGTVPGFHFVDEAMPPALIRKVSEEILRRGLCCEWWGNVRFDTSFTPELCKLMAKAGCIAVTGGLECANDRLLKLMTKGITLASAQKALRAFHRAGIMVHAYLMYGFPTETAEEAYGALDFVRGLFQKNLVQSAFWHRFALTVHSPIAREPERFGISLVGPASGPTAEPAASPARRRNCKFHNRGGETPPLRGDDTPPLRRDDTLPLRGRLFCRNEIPFLESGAPDWKRVGEVLDLALYNFHEGRGLDKDSAYWQRLVARRNRREKR